MHTPAIHNRTPDLQAIDPRGLVVRRVGYCRKTEGATAQAHINRTCHNAAGRAVQQWDPRLWSQGHDDSVTTANVTTVYSLSGLVLNEVGVDSGLQIHLFGVADQAVSRWDGRGTRQRAEYDQLIRPQVFFEQPKGLPQVCAERFEYGTGMPEWAQSNQCGKLVRHDDPAGTLHFNAFSLQGDCLEQRRLFEGADDACTTRWRFSPLGEVLEQIDARDNLQVFGFTVDGRLQNSQLQLKGQSRWMTLVGDIRYSAEGQIECETAGNGVRTTLLYRPQDGRLVERRACSHDARLLQHLIYNYDPQGNVLAIEDKALPVRYFANQRIDPVSCFSYDSLYRLIMATGWEAGGLNQGPQSGTGFDPGALSNYRQTYDYDESGNLLKLTHVGAQSPGHEFKVADYSNRGLPYRNGRPPTEDEIAAAFDDNGNVLELGPGRAVVWNPRNQLQSVSPVQREEGDDDCEWYTYDGQGQRALKVRSLQTRTRTVITRVCYLPGLELRTDSGTGQRWQVINARAGLNTVQVLHWEVEPPAGVSNDQYRCSLVDQLNSCTVELTDDARIISHETYYPFGETAWSCADDKIEADYKTIRYSGKERDATGLYYYGLRYYMPWLQRWLNPDPKGQIDGLNLYQMVGNSPLTHVDLEGDKKTKAELLQVSVDKQATLLDVIGDRAFDLKHSLLNTAYLSHRLKATARRMGAAAGPQLLKGALETGGAALGATVAGPLGAKGGEMAGGKIADAVSGNIVTKYRMDRPIRFTGHEMNPKAIIEAVEPSKPISLATIKLSLAAMDPREKEGRMQLGKNLAEVVLDKAVNKVGGKLGVLGPETLKIGFEAAKASMGLKAEALSEVYDDTSTDIDLLAFRMDAIRTEFAAAGSTDEGLFTQVADLSQQTQDRVEMLQGIKTTIELLAPNPYAGRRHSLKGQRGGQLLTRQASI